MLSTHNLPSHVFDVFVELDHLAQPLSMNELKAHTEAMLIRKANKKNQQVVLKEADSVASTKF